MSVPDFPPEPRDMVDIDLNAPLTPMRYAFYQKTLDTLDRYGVDSAIDLPSEAFETVLNDLKDLIEYERNN